MHVSAPGSSANLGSGFDCLGLALDIPFELTDRAPSTEHDPRFHLSESTHPARRAFVAAGGSPECDLWWRSSIPPGRGLGFSGAARVAGAFLGLGASEGSVQDAYVLAAELEGHADNAAASALGGLVVAGQRTPHGDTVDALRVVEAVGIFHGLRLVVWSPTTSTSTNASRRDLPETVSLEVAAASIAGSAMWVAAATAGRLDLLKAACRDRLHQPARLALRPDAEAILDKLLTDVDVLAAWLSGSGPTIAALARGEAEAEAVSARASGGGTADAQVRILEIATSGVRRINT